MAVSQELLSAVSNIQPNAQAGLPVMPNNGNPGGVYNMPAQAQQVANAAPSVAAVKPGYEWLLPSPAMNTVQAILQRQKEMLEQAPPNMSGKYNTMVRDGEFVDEMLDESGLPLIQDPVGVAQQPQAIMPSHGSPQSMQPVLPTRAY